MTSKEGFSVVDPKRMMSPSPHRQEGALLGFVEAVDLVDEDDRRLAVHPLMVLGLGHDVLDFLDAGKDGAEEQTWQVEVPASIIPSVVLPDPGGPRKSGRPDGRIR